MATPAPVSYESNPAITPVRRKPGLDFSLTGLVYCAMMMFMGLAAINSQANLLFGVFGLMIGVLVVSGIVSRLVLRGIRVSRVLPEHGTVGTPANVTYEFTNYKKFWPSLSICLGELDGVQAFVRQPQSYLLHAAGGTTASVPSQVIPKRRGVHVLGRHQISTSFPFGFIKRAIERDAHDTFIVYPPVGTVDNRLLALCQPAEKTGPTMRPRRGGMDEVYGLKEYRRGESTRLIHWKRSARTGVLVSKEMTQVAPPRLLLLVDTYIAERSTDEHAAVEKAIAMAASLGSAALEQGLLVGAHAWNDGYNGLTPNRGKRQRRDLLTMLAQLPLNTTEPTANLIKSAQDLIDPGTTAVLLTPRKMEQALGDQLRGNLLIVSVNSPQAAGWFRFDPAINFEHCMPPEQEMAVGEGSDE